MATNKVILYFEEESDALRFTVAAGSIMSGADDPATGQNVLRVVQPLARASRIRVDKTATAESKS